MTAGTVGKISLFFFSILVSIYDQYVNALAQNLDTQGF